MKRYIFFIILLLAAQAGIAQHKSVLPVNDFEKAVTKPGVQLLDVRTAGEYKEGHIRAAVNADWQNEKEFTAKVAALNKKEPVYVYCLSGVRSGKAADWLAQNGFTDIVNLDGGIKAWKAANKSLETK